MIAALHSSYMLRELAAPAGWTAALLEVELPLASKESESYAAAIAELRAELEAIVERPQRELFLLFERCRPAIEVPIIQRNARWWMPEFGMGVWLDQEAPSTWSAEEFTTAAPGTLRPVIDRVLRLSRDSKAQEHAWRMLAGSGTLISVVTTTPDRFVRDATASIRPRITDPSLTSFPFYLPLLTAEALKTPSAFWNAPLEDVLPEVQVYFRESVEEGGLLIAIRHDPVTFWNGLSRKQFASLRLQRSSPQLGH